MSKSTLSVKVIKDRAYESCLQLTALNLGEGLEEIEVVYSVHAHHYKRF
jgi:hypothetical protein